MNLILFLLGCCPNFRLAISIFVQTFLFSVLLNYIHFPCLNEHYMAGLSQAENTEASAEKLNARLEVSQFS